MQFTPPQYQSLQWAARYRGIRKLLRRSAIGLLIFTLLIALGGFGLYYGSNRKAEEMGGLIILGISGVLLLQVLLNVFLPRAWLFISQGILLLILGTLMLISTCGAMLALRGIPVLGLLLALWLMGLGATSLQRFRDYRAIPTKSPPPELLDWVNATAATLRKTKPAVDPTVIEFKAQYQIGFSPITWRGRLAPDSITLTDKSGADFLILDRMGISVMPGKPTLFRKTLVKATIMLNNQRFHGTIDYTSLDRFVRWVQSGYQANPPSSNGSLWVPRA